jgi:hypothetical protein
MVRGWESVTPFASRTTSEADTVPAEAGVKVTLIEQELPTATVRPQVVGVSEKAPFAPVNRMMKFVRVAVPVFVSVTVCPADVLPTSCEVKVSEVGENVAGTATPMPLRGRSVCGMGLFDSMLRVDVSVPTAVGE